MLDGVELRYHRLEDLFILLIDGHLQHFGIFFQGQCNAIQGSYDRLKKCTFTTQGLRRCRDIPNVGVFQFAIYFFEPVLLASVVKDTPSTLRSAAAGPGSDYLIDWFPHFYPEFGAMHFTPWRADGPAVFLVGLCQNLFHHQLAGFMTAKMIDVQLVNQPDRI